MVNEDEVEIKPQISGIIEKIFVEEGDKIKIWNIKAAKKDDEVKSDSEDGESEDEDETND